MIKLASPRTKVYPVSTMPQFSVLNRLASKSCSASIPQVPSRYEFVGAPTQKLPTDNSQNQFKSTSSAKPSFSPPIWKVALDGVFVLLLMAIIFGTSAMMLGHVTLEFASFGDSQILESLR